MGNNRTTLTAAAMLSIALSAAGASASPIYYGPAPYASAADSPFAGVGFLYSHLETFEDGLTTPGVAASGGIAIGSDPFVDSVDSDDGALDGSGGSTGHSWYSNGLTHVTFTFDQLALGTLPTHVGVVWTDIGYNAPTAYLGPVSFEAFGPGGVSLGLLGPFVLGDGLDTGQTAEDRFFGIQSALGISSIRIGTNNGDWELDHLQYGAQAPAPVPEPSTLVLCGLGAVGIVRSRWRARAAARKTPR